MTHGSGADRHLTVDELTRVEGAGALDVVVRDGAVESCRLEIFEPPRLFEGILLDRRAEEAVDITARICGICPAAYQLAASAAIEDAARVSVGGPIRELRRLLMCGEWIQSHALHIHLLHAPDHLGYPDAVAMAADHPADVERGLRIKSAGQRVLQVVGGRAVHPVTPRAGGFWHLPGADDLRVLREVVARALDDSLATVEWVGAFETPALEVEHPFLALADDAGYPMLGERLVSSTGLDVPIAAFGDHVVETQVPWSTALHARLDGEIYLTGPLARWAMAAGALGPIARAAASSAGLEAVVRDPFRAIVVRAVETVHACETALAILERWDPPDAPAIDVPAGIGVGHGAVEAPRGVLYHRYELTAAGTIADARIIPPTAQNQAAIEFDVGRLVSRELDRTDDVLTAQCEQLIRAYDPCISCATHFLDLRVVRR